MTRNNQDYDHGITLLDAEYGKPGVAAIYLMEQEGEVAIIETGTNHSVPLIKKALAGKGLSFKNVRYIMPTHVHLDHAGGAGELMYHCPNAELVIHPFGARHMVDPGKLKAGTIAVYGEDKFSELYGDIRPVDADRVIEAPDDFILVFNGRELRFLDTPGHARHHYCIVDKQSQAIFSGDTFGLSYPQITTRQGRFIFATTTPVQFDPGDLLQSIERLLSYQPAHIYLTHFGEIKPTPDIVEQLKDSIRAFANIALEHQHESHNRQDKIRSGITSYLMNKLQEMECEQSPRFCEAVIDFDMQLNAQGLDFWLSKLDKP